MFLDTRVDATGLSRPRTRRAPSAVAGKATRRRVVTIANTRKKRKRKSRGSRDLPRARTISSLRRFGGGSATFPSSNKASSRSSSFSDGCSIAEARSTAAAAEAFSRRRSSSFSFFVDAASLALLAGDSVAVRFLCVSKGSSHFWYSCFSAEASEALASVPSSPLAIVRHSLPRHARSKPPWLATTDSYNTRRSSLRPPNTGHLVTVWCSCVCMNSTYSTLQLRCLPFATRSCSSVTVCTRVLNVNEARS